MALLFLSPDDPADLWRAELQARIPELDVRIWPEVGDPAEIDVALVWRPPPGELARYPNLKAILSLAAGHRRPDRRPGAAGRADRAHGRPFAHPHHDRVRAARRAAPPPGVRSLRAGATRARVGLRLPAPGRRAAGRPHGPGRARLRRGARARRPTAFRCSAGAAARRRSTASPAIPAAASCTPSCTAPTSWSACCRSPPTPPASWMPRPSPSCRMAPA